MKPRTLKALIIVVNILFVFVTVIGIFIALTAGMLFDAPGSTQHTALWVAFWCALAFPVLCLLAIILSCYFCFHSHAYKKSLWIFLLPIADLVVMLLSFL